MLVLLLLPLLLLLLLLHRLLLCSDFHLVGFFLEQFHKFRHDGKGFLSNIGHWIQQQGHDRGQDLTGHISQTKERFRFETRLKGRQSTRGKRILHRSRKGRHEHLLQGHFAQVSSQFGNENDRVGSYRSFRIGLQTNQVAGQFFDAGRVKGWYQIQCRLEGEFAQGRTGIVESATERFKDGGVEGILVQVLCHERDLVEQGSADTTIFDDE
mmetsp:Transcript_109978/g.164509  ORF Transcript_109978/g.164509 Transcript_109978/m.164509 type:complete len:211 (+) Transcript_109978:956-1588(+)